MVRVPPSLVTNWRLTSSRSSFGGVDVTDELPFPVTKMSPYLIRSPLQESVK